MKEPILYIDDEKVNLNSFRMALGRHFKIHLAQEVETVFELLASIPVKILISDQRMPAISGLELIKKVKEQYPDIVCIILTAFSDVGVALEALNQGGVFRFIMKPWDNDEMLMTLRNAITTYNLKLENKKLLTELQFKNHELEAYNEELIATTMALQETNTELIEAKQKAEESDRLKSAFLANMSHEIRTPMNGIIGFSEMIAMPSLDDEKRSYYSGIIIKSSNQLLSIVNDILDISRIETGQILVNKEQVDINEFIDELFSFYTPQAKEKELSLENDKLYTNEACVFVCDVTKLRQVFTNLLSNAIKFTHSGGIKFGYTENNGKIVFYVTDTGIGIALENYENIFDRFRQVETALARKYGGTGLGLSISKALVEHMGGQIWLDSELDLGSTFSFTIPIQKNNS